MAMTENSNITPKTKKRKITPCRLQTEPKWIASRESTPQVKNTSTVDVQKILEDIPSTSSNNQGSGVASKQLIKILCNESTDRETAVKIILEFRNKIFLFDGKKDETLNLLLNRKWDVKYFKKDEGIKVLNELLMLLSELIELKPARFQVIFTKVILPLLSGDQSISRECIPNDFEKSIFKACHNFVACLLRIFPFFDKFIISTLKRHFPYCETVSPHSYICYLTNCLMAFSYVSSKNKLLNLVFDKILWLATKYEQKKSKTDNLNEILDAAFSQLFNFLKLLVHRAECKGDERAFQELLRILIPIFKKLVIPVNQSSHIQFVIFYMCSLNETICRLLFASFWDIITDNNEENFLLQHKSICYSSSLLVRGNFISIEGVLNYIEIWIKWALKYVEESSLNKHQIFYSLCQAIFHVIVQRHHEFNESHLKLLRTLNFQRLVTSNLNPIGHCERGLASHFVDVAKHYRLAYCSRMLSKSYGISSEVFKNTCSELHEVFDMNEIKFNTMKARVEQFYHRYPEERIARSIINEIYTDKHIINSSFEYDPDMFQLKDLSDGFSSDEDEENRDMM